MTLNKVIWCVQFYGGNLDLAVEFSWLTKLLRTYGIGFCIFGYLLHEKIFPNKAGENLFLALPNNCCSLSSWKHKRA